MRRRTIWFSEEQIIGILKEHEAGLPLAEICRKHGISDATFDTVALEVRLLAE